MRLLVRNKIYRWVVVLLLLWTRLSAQSVANPNSRSDSGSSNNDDLPNFELGFVSNVLNTNPGDSHVGLGARGVYNLHPRLTVEGEVNYFLKDSRTGLREGGAITQGLFGVKSGYRFSRVGLFVKVRPGFLSFSNTVLEPSFAAPIDPTSAVIIRQGRLTRPALDLGIVVEFYLSKHWAIRTDWGDTMVFYDATQFQGVSVRGMTNHSFQSSGSIQYRF